MNFRIELYNTDVNTTKEDSVSAILILIYMCFLVFWVLICLKKQTYVKKIHILMGALLAIVTLDLICGPADKQCVKVTSTADGSWDVVFYIFKFMRVVLLYTVIALMCSGWSFLRRFLQPKEKLGVITVILFNVASVVAREINHFNKYLQPWFGWFYVVIVLEGICLFSFLIPISGTGRWLAKACMVNNGRSFAKNKQLITWLDDDLTPMIGFIYSYFWRCSVLGVKVNPHHHYFDTTVGNVMEEVFSLVFCMVTFYMYWPVEILDIEDEEVEVPQPNQTDQVLGQNNRNVRRRGRKNRDQVSFSYPKLPEDFEW